MGVVGGGGDGSESKRLVWGGGWGGWIFKRCLKVPPLQGGVDLKGGVELSDISGLGFSGN